MLWKLLKYDFRAMWKKFTFLWAAALAVALLNRTTLQQDGGNLRMLAVVAVSAFVSILMAMFVVTLVFIVLRFYRGLLGEEGYLMHTLPVRAWQLVTSKLISAVAVMAVSGLVSVLAILLLFPGAVLEQVEYGVLYVLRVRQEELGVLAMDLFTGLASTLRSVLMAYFAMALGHLFNRHRVLFSVLAYVVLEIVLTRVFQTAFGVIPLVNVLTENWSEGLNYFVWKAAFAELAQAAVCYVGACCVLKYRLNLE